MSICAIQVVLKTADGISANYCTNTYHADIDRTAISPGPEDLYPIVASAFTGMYGDIFGIFGGLEQNGHEITFYDLSEPIPRVPFYMENWDFPAAISADKLPSEVSIVSSFKTNREAGKSDRNRRNRVYLGPLRPTTLDESTGRILDNTRTAIATAFQSIASQSGSEDDWTWVIYSPTLGESYPVKEGFVNNSFDTQRRRGVASTFRTTWVEDAS